MPRGDGTGPVGRGPMTGRGAGYCAGFNVPGYMNAVPGRGRARAWRRGFARAGYVPMVHPQATAGASFGQPQGYYGSAYSTEETQKQELQYLKNTEKAIAEDLEAVKNRIEELENNLDK
ncbi:MAG: DUF5320 domain-containing protein [Halanaerobiales bacterium]